MAEAHHAHGSLLQVLCAGLLAATILFNPLLAFASAHGVPMNGGLVAAVQGVIVVAALVIGASQPQTFPYRWLLLAWGLIAASVLTATIRAQLDLKSLGDVLLIPAFVMLGSRLNVRTLVVTLLILQALIVVVGIWELADPQSFGAVFKVADYYVRTRGFSADAFWAGGDLFVSSERPQGRLLLAGSGLHRASSLFLEPVSLGNWTVVTTIATAMLWRSLSPLARGWMIASTVVLLVMCDGRLALTVNLILLLWLPVARHVPERFSALYLPLCLLLLVLAMQVGLLDEVGDTFTGRLRYGMEAFGRLGADRLLGISARRIGFDDAGFAYIILHQSVVVAIGLWLTLTLTSLGDDPVGRTCKHGVALFLVLCLPVSNALLSIKTAAMMWACYGYCYGRADRRTVVARVARPAMIRTAHRVPVHG